MGHVALDVAFEDQIGEDALNLVHLHRLARDKLERLLEILQTQLVALANNVAANEKRSQR